MMDLVDEDDGFAAGSSEPISRCRHHFAHLRHITFHATQPNEFGVGHLGDDIRQRSFATSGWARNYQRRQPIGFDGATQEFPGRQNMFLSDKFIEGTRTHARCEGSGGTDALQVFSLAFGEQIVHSVKCTARAGWAHLQICESGCSWHWRCQIEWSKQTPLVVIPDERDLQLRGRSAYTPRDGSGERAVLAT